MSGGRTRPITPTSLFTLGVDEIIGSLAQFVMGDIPEGINSQDDLAQIEYYLGRLGNDYAYLIELLSYSRNYVRRLKRDGHKEKSEDLMDIRDGIESMASAVKLRYQAVSRLLTIHEQRNDENTMPGYRLGRENE